MSQATAEISHFRKSFKHKNNRKPIACFFVVNSKHVQLKKNCLKLKNEDS